MSARISPDGKEIHMTLRLFSNMLCLVASAVLGSGCSLPAYAGATDLVARVKAVKGLAEPMTQVIATNDQTLIILNLDSKPSDEAVTAYAQQLAKLISTEPAASGKPLRVIVCGAGVAKSVVVAAQELALAKSSGATLISTGEVADYPGTEQEALYNSLRGRILARIQNLEHRGAGTKPFLATLAQADSEFKNGQTIKAQASLYKLEEPIAGQESQLSLRAARNTASSNPRLAAGHGDPRASGTANFQGTADAYYDEVAKSILQRELGDLAPCDGPFRLERFRIGKRLQELRQRGVSIDANLTLYRRTEELAAVANKNPRRLPELSDNIRYMEKQLGLTELQGSQHRSY